MEQVMNTLGTTLTQFLKGLVNLWEWFNTPLDIPFMGEVQPIALFGVGFLALLTYIFIRSLII